MRSSIAKGNAISFVDRDMVMRHYGGGIGHFGNTIPQTADPIILDTEEVQSAAVGDREQLDDGAPECEDIASDDNQDVTMNFSGDIYDEDEAPNSSDSEPDNYDYDGCDGSESSDSLGSGDSGNEYISS